MDANSLACLVCTVGVVNIRGVCMACYQKQRQAIANRETTDERLVKEGKRLPKKKPGSAKAWTEPEAWVSPNYGGSFGQASR